MVIDSFDHAEEDFSRLLLIEARNEADTILSVVERAPRNAAWQQLQGDEQASIMAECNRLAIVKHGDDLAAIREATEAVDLATRRFAELMMEAAVTAASRGKTRGRII